MKLLSTQPYKGTRDFYPREMVLRNWFFGKIRKTLEDAAFDEYAGPMLESLELYAAKSGEEIANEQTYHFTDRGDRHLAIRPEMTPTVARMVSNKIGELNFPLKWFSMPNCYRYERPQRGRLREFWQVNVDIFGCDTYEADLEAITSAIRILRAFGADETMFRVHINNRRFFNDVIDAIVMSNEEGMSRKVSKIVDKKNKIPRENYEKEMGELGITAEQIAKIDALYGMSVANATALCPESRGAQELASLFDMLSKMGLDRYCTFDFGIVRGLDYYTGTVFEVFDLAPENNRAMFGGGRYDNLVGLFVKNQISGVGYGLGDVTLENFLTIHNLIPDLYTGGTKVLVTVFDDVPYEHTACLVESLRDAGVAATLYIGKKKFGKQLDWGVRQGFSHVVIIGGSEYEAGEAKVKNLVNREEQTVKVDELIAFFA